MKKRLLYPIFLPFVVWGCVFAAWILFSEPPNDGATDPMSSNIFAAGATVFVALLIGTPLQVLLGLPSLFLLRRWRSLRAHLVVGGALGCAVASAASVAVLQDGEDVFKAVPYWALFVLPPFLAGYARLYYIRARELALQSES